MMARPRPCHLGHSFPSQAAGLCLPGLLAYFAGTRGLPGCSLAVGRRVNRGDLLRCGAAHCTDRAGRQHRQHRLGATLRHGIARDGGGQRTGATTKSEGRGRLRRGRSALPSLRTESTAGQCKPDLWNRSIDTLDIRRMSETRRIDGSRAPSGSTQTSFE